MASEADDTNGDEDKNNESSSGNEVTAEWIVRAQLKLSKSKKKKASSFGHGDCGARRSTGSPCRVVYKWNSDGKNQDQSKARRQNSYNEKPSESGSTLPTQQHSSEMKSETNDEICQSTCSIVLTTDICPAKILKKSSAGGCTTHTYTFSPDQTQIIHDIRQSDQKILVSKDVSCQTSDIEILPKKKAETERFRDQSPSERRKKYEHRRATDSIASGHCEGGFFTPSRSPKQSSPVPSSNLSPRSKDKKKPPRTVHIDVYCTGSDVDTSNSSNPSSPNIVDDITNIMAQATVVEADDMILKHQRVVNKGDLPRKLIIERKPKITSADEPDNQLFDFTQMLLQNSANEKEELSESKQMLFKKYIGDQRQIHKFNELRSMMHFRRDLSDDAISSNYANSSYSPTRDLTSSSIGSAFTNSPSTVFEDSESVWKDLDVAIKSGDFITPSESFKKLDKSGELNKMKEVERLWNRGGDPARDLFSQHKLMENFLFINKQQTDSDNSANLSESDHSVIYQKSNEMGNISDSSPSTVISCSHKKSKSITIPVNDTQRSPAPSTASSLRSGDYSKDHLALAAKFGTVMRTMKKPGHHVGPVRNPACLCETCKRWMLEREDTHGRGRAFSFGDTPITRSSFWRRNNRSYV